MPCNPLMQLCPSVNSMQIYLLFVLKILPYRIKGLKQRLRVRHKQLEFSLGQNKLGSSTTWQLGNLANSTPNTQGQWQHNGS